MKQNKKIIQLHGKFKWVKGYEKIYEVSDKGYLKSHHSNEKGRMLSPNKDGAGYLLHWLHKDGKQKRVYLHRLVAEAHVKNPNPKIKIIVHHKNSVKNDCRAGNLIWLTHAENMKIAGEQGKLSGFGVQNGHCKISDEDIIKIRKEYDWYSGKKSEIIKKLVKEYKISIRYMRSIINCKVRRSTELRIYSRLRPEAIEVRL